MTKKRRYKQTPSTRHVFLIFKPDHLPTKTSASQKEPDTSMRYSLFNLKATLALVTKKIIKLKLIVLIK